MRILVVGPSWVGDMIMAQSLFKVLKANDPAARIDVLAPGWTLPLLARMPEVQEGIPLPIGHGEFALRRRYQIGRALRARRYEQAIVLPNSLKSAFIPFFAGAQRRTGFIGEARWGWLNDARPLDRKALPRTVDRFVALGLAPGAPLPPIPQPQLMPDSEAGLAAAARLGLNTNTPVLALCPGAEFGPAKRWPARYFAEVARAKLGEGWQVWLFGSEKDTPVTADIQALTANRCMDLAGRTQLGEAIDLLALATAVVSNDSGLMHVAAALDRRLIAVFGSSDPTHTPPLSARATSLSLQLSCSPCFKRECPLGHLRCLNDLPPERVLAALAA